MILKIVLILITFTDIILPDESWKVYDESELAIIHVTVNPEDLEWMYDNVESDLSISFFSISEKLNIESLHIVSITSII